MSEFKIEKNVEFPRNPASKYPFLDMEIGDSFFVSVDRECEKSYTGQRITNSGRMVTGYKFSYRKVEGGVRIWRVKNG